MNVTKLTTIVALSALCLAHSATAQESAVVVQRVNAAVTAQQAPRVRMAQRSAQYRAEGAVKAEFTVGGAESLAPVYSYNFDAGLEGWTYDPTTYVTWTRKQIGAPGTAKSFSAIDPADKMSLFVEGPYQTYRREKSSATSPNINVPANGTLDAYIGYSQNYDDACRLILTVSTDNFTTSTEVWNSKDEQGERTWRWHRIAADLSRWAGQTVKLRFTYTYGSKDEVFKTGGYLGDFAIDGITINGLKPVQHVDLTTGQRLQLTNLSTDAVSYSWEMPGATPSTSTETNPVIYYTAPGVYGITLTATNAAGQTASVTRQDFVTVTGTEPTAAIGLPATFRLASTRRHMVAPLAPVQFSNASAGYPTAQQWTFTGVNPTANQLFTTTEANPTVSYAYLHNQSVQLDVANEKGASTATADLSVEYSGVVTNMRPSDQVTNFNMQDWGVFPGSNTRKITAYAEKFSRPSRPVVVAGAYVYFTRAQATALTDQIADIGVHLYTSKDGKPDKRLDCMWWRVFELDQPQNGDLVGTAFQFDKAPVVDDEFFIVVDGIPEYNDSCCVTFGMAGFRPDGNTAYMLKDDQWMPVSDYFPRGANCTSYMIYPEVHHSVMAWLDGEGVAKVGAAPGTIKRKLFSYMGYKANVDSDSDWLRVVSTPNDMTVDEPVIAYDMLPAGTAQRTGTLTFTDGASTLTLTVTQSGNTAITAVEAAADTAAEYYTLTGQRADSRRLVPGLYLRRTPTATTKVTIH